MNKKYSNSSSRTSKKNKMFVILPLLLALALIMNYFYRATPAQQLVEEQITLANNNK